MFAALSSAFAQLPDPRIRAVVFRALGLTVLAYILVFAGMVWGLGQLEAFDMGWANWALEWGIGILAFALSMMIFPAILTMFAGFFLETVADAVEDRHYPHLPPAHPVAIPDALLSGLALLGKAIVFNLLALPLYLLVPALNLVIFYVLNGFLLGREYFEVVSLRRMDRKAVKRIWTERRGYLVLCGALIAFLSTIPVLNLLSPVLGTAFMVHICERLRRGDQSA